MFRLVLEVAQFESCLAPIRPSCLLSSLVAMADGRGNLCGWLSHVHYVLERRNMRYPSTPALGRLLVATSMVRPRWDPSVWEDIRRLEALTGVSFNEYLMNRVIPVLADPAVCATNPANRSIAPTSDAHSLAVPASSDDYPVANERTICKKGKAKLVVSTSSSHGRSDDHRGGDSSGFDDPFPRACSLIEPLGDGVGPTRVLFSDIENRTVNVVAVAKEAEKNPIAEVLQRTSLVPYSDSSDSAGSTYKPARLGHLYFTAPTQSRGENDA